MKRHISKDDLNAKMSELAMSNGSFSEYEELLEKWQEQEKQFHNYLCDKKYNGVLGKPPDWVPKYIQEQFFDARISMLDNTIDLVNKPHDPESIKLSIDYKLEEKGPFKSPGEGFSTWAIPSNVKDSELYIRDFEILMKIWSLVLKGEKQALKEITGDKSFAKYERLVVSDKGSTAGKAKKNTEGPLKATIRKLGAKDFQELLDALGNQELIDDLYGSTNISRRIDIHTVEIHVVEEATDEEKQKNVRVDGFIKYTIRNGQEKECSFKNLRNRLSEIIQK